MQHVMVHIDQTLGPIGAWSYQDGSLMHFYPESLDTAISARAREVMAARRNDLSVPEWMDLLAGCEPTMLDEYQAFAVTTNITLPTILAEFRRNWTASD